MSTLTESINLFDFFHDRVQAARANVSPQFHDDTVLYIAQLLADRARTPVSSEGSQTLAELHGAAAQASPGKQAATYRELGDRSLYQLGFFREHLDRARRPIGPSYYADMGAAAYHRCDQVLKRWFADAFGPVFAELSRDFQACVDLLTAVRRDADPSTDGFARAYERWLLSSGSLPTDVRIPGGIIVVGDPDIA